jgi:hypothetical protein
VKDRIEAGHCPDCDYRGFVLGPKGGAAQNIECGNVECRSRFNVTFWSSAVVMADRIEKVSEGGLPWKSEPK